MVDGTHLELYIKSKACKSKIEYSCICCLLGPQSGKHRKLKLIRAQYLFMNTEIKSFVLWEFRDNSDLAMLGSKIDQVTKKLHTCFLGKTLSLAKQNVTQTKTWLLWKLGLNSFSWLQIIRTEKHIFFLYQVIM